MGNSAITGHVLANSMNTTIGFQKSLQITMKQLEIEPWSAKQLLQLQLQRQRELATRCPFRFVPVEEGLAHFGQHCGGWLVRLSREKFLELALELVKDKQVGVASRSSSYLFSSVFGGGNTPPVTWDQREFYDVFDSIDLYRDGELSVGELAGGLESFFWGGLNNRVGAVFDLLDSNKDGRMPKEALKSYVKPFVYAMVPSTAKALREILLPGVVDELFKEIDTGETGYISRDEMLAWHSKGAGYNVVERVAALIDGAVYRSWLETKEKQRLVEYRTQNPEYQSVWNQGLSITTQASNSLQYVTGLLQGGSVVQQAAAPTLVDGESYGRVRTSSVASVASAPRRSRGDSLMMVNGGLASNPEVITRQSTGATIVQMPYGSTQQFLWPSAVPATNTMMMGMDALSASGSSSMIGATAGMDALSSTASSSANLRAPMSARQRAESLDETARAAAASALPLPQLPILEQILPSPLALPRQPLQQPVQLWQPSVTTTTFVHQPAPTMANAFKAEPGTRLY